MTGAAARVAEQATPRRAPPGPGTVLGFDYGERFVGVAVGESGVRVAHPLTTIDTRVAAARFRAIAALIAEWQPVRLVVGLPLALAGDRHELTRRAERFARQLETRVPWVYGSRDKDFAWEGTPTPIEDHAAPPKERG